MHLNGTVDRRGELSAGAFQWNDDIIHLQLRVANDFLRATHRTESDVNAIEHLVPMCHRLRGKNLVEDFGQLRHVLHQLGRFGEARIDQ